jgi:hypothetical protein
MVLVKLPGREIDERLMMILMIVVVEVEVEVDGEQGPWEQWPPFLFGLAYDLAHVRQPNNYLYSNHQRLSLEITRSLSTVG